MKDLDAIFWPMNFFLRQGPKYEHSSAVRVVSQPRIGEMGHMVGILSLTVVHRANLQAVRILESEEKAGIKHYGAHF